MGLSLSCPGLPPHGHLLVSFVEVAGFRVACLPQCPPHSPVILGVVVNPDDVFPQSPVNPVSQSVIHKAVFRAGAFLLASSVQCVKNLVLSSFRPKSSTNPNPPKFPHFFTCSLSSSSSSFLLSFTFFLYEKYLWISSSKHRQPCLNGWMIQY